MMNLLLFWQDIREKSLQELFLFVSDKRRWRWSPVLACAHTIHSETFMKTSEQNLALYWDCDELQLSPLNHLKRQCPMFNAISQFFNDIWRHPDHFLCLCLQWPFLDLWSWWKPSKMRLIQDDFTLFRRFKLLLFLFVFYLSETWARLLHCPNKLKYHQRPIFILWFFLISACKALGAWRSCRLLCFSSVLTAPHPFSYRCYCLLYSLIP